MDLTPLAIALVEVLAYPEKRQNPASSAEQEATVLWDLYLEQGNPLPQLFPLPDPMTDVALEELFEYADPVDQYIWLLHWFADHLAVARQAGTHTGLLDWCEAYVGKMALLVEEAHLAHMGLVHATVESSFADSFLWLSQWIPLEVEDRWATMPFSLGGLFLPSPERIYELWLRVQLYQLTVLFGDTHDR